MTTPEHTFRSRKFLLAGFFSVSGTLALGLGSMGGGEYVALVTAVLGLYAAGSVGDKAVKK